MARSLQFKFVYDDNVFLSADLYGSTRYFNNNYTKHTHARTHARLNIDGALLYFANALLCAYTYRITGQQCTNFKLYV